MERLKKKFKSFVDELPELGQEIVAFEIGIDWFEQYSGVFTKERHYENYSIDSEYISDITTNERMFWMCKKDYDKEFRAFLKEHIL